MKWAIKNALCLKNKKTPYENGKDGCFPTKMFDWSRMFWLDKQSKSLNGQWLVNQLLILHPNCKAALQRVALIRTSFVLLIARRTKNLNHCVRMSWLIWKWLYQRWFHLLHANLEPSTKWTRSARDPSAKSNVHSAICATQMSTDSDTMIEIFCLACDTAN